MSNLAAVMQAINVNWTTKWVPKPTFRARELLKQHELSNEIIIYEDVTQDELPIDFGKRWKDYKHEFKLLLRSETKANVRHMRSEIDNVLNHHFYPAPFKPKWEKDEANVLCHLALNEGSGNPADSTDNNYDFTLGAGDHAPTWITTGAFRQKNCLEFNSGNTNTYDYISNGTLLDTVPSALSLEVVFKLSSGFHAAMASISTYMFVKKYNSVTPYEYCYINTSGDYGGNAGIIQYVANRGATPVENTNLSGGYLHEEQWYSVLGTHGSLGNFLYLNGICIAYDTTKTNLPNDGTADQFYLMADYNGSPVNAKIQIALFRCSSVQRFPYEDLYSTRLTQITEKKHIYEAELTIIGELPSVYVGGQV